jgi:hypothetical protein
MKKVCVHLLAYVVVFSIVMVSCKKDDTTEAELSKEIKNIVPDSILQKITNMGKLTKALPHLI